MSKGDEMSNIVHDPGFGDPAREDGREPGRAGETGAQGESARVTHLPPARAAGGGVPVRVLILTDSRTHDRGESLYPMARHLAGHPDIGELWIADRAEPANRAFFYTHDRRLATLSARRADTAVTYDSAFDPERYPLRPLDLGAVEGVWIRMDHPVPDAFLRYLDGQMAGAFICHSPQGLIRTSSKAFLAELAPRMAGLMPELALCHETAEIMDFKAHFEEGLVLKTLRSHGGKGVVRLRDAPHATDLDGPGDVAHFLATHGPVVAMRYLEPAVGAQSDNRLIVMNGELLGVVQRVAGAGGWQCNITAGGHYRDAEPTARELDILARLDPVMREQQIFLYGVDTLLGPDGRRWLSEVNTLNVGAIGRREQLTGRPLTRLVACNAARVFVQRTVDIQTIRDSELDEVVAASAAAGAGA